MPPASRIVVHAASGLRCQAMASRPGRSRRSPSAQPIVSSSWPKRSRSEGGLSTSRAARSRGPRRNHSLFRRPPPTRSTNRPAAISKLPRPITAFLDDQGDSAGRSAPGGPHSHVDSPQCVSETLVPMVKTDSDGRFEMRGLGCDWLTALRISASRTATIFASVLTRPIS